MLALSGHARFLARYSDSDKAGCGSRPACRGRRPVGSGLLSSGAGALSAPFKFAWAWARTPARAVAAAGRRGPGARNFSNCQQPEPVCVARLGPDSDAKAPASLTVTVARKQGLAPPGSTHGPWYPAVPFNFGRGIE